jgi:hypothetical protein
VYIAGPGIFSCETVGTTTKRKSGANEHARKDEAGGFPCAEQRMTAFFQWAHNGSVMRRADSPLPRHHVTAVLALE